MSTPSIICVVISFFFLEKSPNCDAGAVGRCVICFVVCDGRHEFRDYENGWFSRWKKNDVEAHFPTGKAFASAANYHMLCVINSCIK